MMKIGKMLKKYEKKRFILNGGKVECFLGGEFQDYSFWIGFCFCFIYFNQQLFLNRDNGYTGGINFKIDKYYQKFLVYRFKRKFYFFRFIIGSCKFCRFSDIQDIYFIYLFKNGMGQNIN